MTSRRRASRPARQLRARRGFTLIELIVTIVVLAVGMLGMAALAGTAARMMDGARHQTVAATVAQSRMERLRSVSCGSTANGSDTTRGVIASWSVAPVTRGRSILVTVNYDSRRGRRTQAYRSILPC